MGATVAWSVVGGRCVHLGAIAVEVIIVERDDVWRLEISAVPRTALTHLLLKVLPPKGLKVAHSHNLFIFTVNVRR